MSVTIDNHMFDRVHHDAERDVLYPPRAIRAPLSTSAQPPRDMPCASMPLANSWASRWSARSARSSKRTISHWHSPTTRRRGRNGNIEPAEVETEVTAMNAGMKAATESSVG
jgi:hypothetical protein